MTIRAQKFYNLTAQQVKIDSVAPTFACAIPLSGDYADSVYTVCIAYPEYIDMTAADVARYRLATHDVQPGASTNCPTRLPFSHASYTPSAVIVSVAR